MVLGAPILEDIGWTDLNDNQVLTPIISRVHVSFSDLGATHGTFPIKYLVTYAEASEPVSGVLYLTIPTSSVNHEEQMLVTNISMDYLESTSPPDIDDKYVIDSKNVTITSMANINDTINGTVIEKRQDNYAVIELYINDVKMYVELDVDSDGFIDSLFLHDISLDTEVERWWQFSYKESVEFLPVSRISSSPKDYADIFWKVILEK